MRFSLMDVVHINAPSKEASVQLQEGVSLFFNIQLLYSHGELREQSRR